MMKKTLDKIDFLIYLCQQIHGLLKAAPDTLKSLAAPQIEYLSMQQIADKCFVSMRQVRRYLDEGRIQPVYFGASPYFALDHIEDAISRGDLRMRKRQHKEVILT
jgi:hypothetical protein